MKKSEIFILAILSFSLMTTCTGAQNKKPDSTLPEITVPLDKAVINPVNNQKDSNIKILTEGSSSKVETPFVFVARSKEDYAQIQTLVDNLPAATEIDFAGYAVIAAFAGTINSGGYTINIGKTDEKFAVSITSPPPDAMVTQALTQPFKVALVPLSSKSELVLELAAVWTGTLQNYNVASGQFEYSGGFIGKRRQFAVKGSIGVLTFGDLITLNFDLSGKDGDKTLKLAGSGSGTIKEGKAEIAELNVGSFSENPKPPDIVSGTFINDKLSLTFEALPTFVRDGFEARGMVEAIKIK